MSYSHANSAPYFHHTGMMQQQQQQQQQLQPQHQQRAQYTQHQMQQSQPSYDGQSYNIGYHHATGGGTSVALQQQHHNGTQQSLSFLGDSQSPPQHQQQAGAAQYSSYMPSSNGYHSSSSSQHPSFEDHQYHHHPHYAQQQHAPVHHQHHHQQQQLGSFESSSSSGDYASHHQHLAGPSSAGSPPGGDRNAQLQASGMRPKRRQVKNACVNCQKACKKCDEGRPCSRCIKYGLTDTCEDSMRKERKRGIKRGPYKRRTTTGVTTGSNGSSTASAMGASNSNSSSSSGSLMYGGNAFDGHYHHTAGNGHDYRSNYSAGIGPSSSNSGSLFQRDQSRSAISPDVKVGAGWPSLAAPTADVKGSWAGLGPSASSTSASTSSVDAHSSRLPMLNLQQAQQHGAYGLDGGASQDHRYSSGLTPSASSNAGGRLGLSPSPLYGSHSLASSSSPSLGQQFRPLPASSALSHHQRYQSESSGAYNSSGSSATASTANFSSPRTPLSADPSVNSLAPGGITSPPLSMGFMKSPGGHGHHPLSAASYVHNAPQHQSQSSNGSTPRQFALQMPPMPKGRGGGAAEMFNSVNTMPMRGAGGQFRAESTQDGAVAVSATSALAT